jgi:hypothetical protein
MQRGGIKANRDEAICRILPSAGVGGWIGRVTKIDSNSDGKGVMNVSIAKGVSVKTWNNAISDTGDDTLIVPRTRLFQMASSLRIGQQVLFSGSFIGDRNDCIKEASLSLRGKIEDPEFIFRFADVAIADVATSGKQGGTASAPPVDRTEPLAPTTEGRDRSDEATVVSPGSTVHRGSVLDEQSREEVWKAVQTWIAHLRSGDVGGYRDSYADRLTQYYNHENVPSGNAVAMVVDQIQQYSKREVTVSNPTFEIVDEESVQVDFEKDYRFSGVGVRVNQGKVKSSLRLNRKAPGTWKITAEFDREICWSTQMRDPAMQVPPGTCP